MVPGGVAPRVDRNDVVAMKDRALRCSEAAADAPKKAIALQHREAKPGWDRFARAVRLLSRGEV